MIRIKNFTNFNLDRETFSTVAKKVLKGENRTTETFSLALVKKGEIEKLNKKFRKKNKPTDVLSFELKEPLVPGPDKNYIGEIVICPDVVKENAKKYGVSFESEMLKVFVHGILHLCGYDHEKSIKEAELMENKQEKYLADKK